ncbi:MAG: hypothetical protein J6P53_03840, partial [Mailhella sp.]|nr:hypothetical protein [Mailhella sp.]
MWRGEIIKTLFLDIMPLKRRGLAFTWKSLDQLRARLMAATVYHFDALPEPEPAAPQAEAAMPQAEAEAAAEQDMPDVPAAEGVQAGDASGPRRPGQ